MFPNTMYSVGLFMKYFSGGIQEIVVSGYVGIRATDVCDHVYTVHCSNLECLFIRMLLYPVRCPTSFDALKGL
jgi:hypothetical protein